MPIKEASHAELHVLFFFRGILAKSAKPKPLTRNPKPKTRKQKTETRNPKPKTQNPKTENRKQKTETRKPKTNKKQNSFKLFSIFINCKSTTNENSHY